MLLRRSTTIHARFFLTPTLFGTGSTSDAHLQHLGFTIDAARLCTISWSDWLLAPKSCAGFTRRSRCVGRARSRLPGALQRRRRCFPRV